MSYINGSSRIGLWDRFSQLISRPPEMQAEPTAGKGTHRTHTLGLKNYELTNHLGNVLTTISDRKLTIAPGHYTADITSAQDYFPFGMLMPGRSYQSNSYRFGFNSQEKDDEIFGSTGTSYTAQFWQYDSRLGRRWNLDPDVKPWESPFATFANNPIFLIDPTGADTIKIDIEGKITNIISAKGNHILLDHNNKQLQFNGAEYDTELINKRGIKVGDQLVNYMSESETKKKVDGQGTIYNRVIAKSLGELSLGAYFYTKSLGEIKEKSYKEWDFSHSILGPMVNADPNSNLGKTTRSRGRTYTDDYKYEQYYFFSLEKVTRHIILGTHVILCGEWQEKGQVLLGLN